MQISYQKILQNAFKRQNKIKKLPTKKPVRHLQQKKLLIQQLV
jgi:hypothetical protein